MPTMTRSEAEEFLIQEARLIDDRKLEHWLELFTVDGLYWLPINEDADPNHYTSVIYDTPIRRQERVYRILHTPAPACNPVSRTLHFISNVTVEPGEHDGEIRILSNQQVFELRVGDYRQPGLGDQRTFVGRTEHLLRWQDAQWRIALKKMVLLNRDLPISNLTFVV